MEDKKDTVPKTDSSSEKHQESKKFLVFYVIGLFCVALALILLSYISQVRADRRLNELSSQLTTQTSAVEGANARLQVLQHSVGRTGESAERTTKDTRYPDERNRNRNDGRDAGSCGAAQPAEDCAL